MKAILETKIEDIERDKRLWLAISSPKTIEQKIQKLFVMMNIQKTEQTRKGHRDMSRVEIIKKIGELNSYIPKT